MKRTRTVAPLQVRANKRAGAIVELLLKEIERGIGDQTLLKKPEWESLFGSKQSVVVNLQKLVQTLAEMPPETQPNKQTPTPEGAERLTDEEMEMLTAWLAEGQPG